MALKETTNELKKLLAQIISDIEKADGGNKAASQRVRTGTVRLEKVAKRYRKESIGSEKKTKGTKKPVKKAAAKTKAAPKAAPKKAAAKHTKPKATKTKGKSSSASAGTRALSVKRPAAKLPVHRFRFS